MKKTLGTALIVSSLFLVAFNQVLSIDDVISAMRTGNATRLSEYFDARIDVTLPGKSDNYSKSQAEMILKDFFSTNKVRSFEVKHRGENKDGSLFCVGTLVTQSGTYRTKFFMKQKGKEQLLQEIGFELID